jgi:hypothetical protein
MEEIVFFVEASDDGGCVAKALGQTTVTEADTT